MNWLVEEFTFLGVPFQNWMLLALAIIVSSIFYTWITGQFRK
jgi:hypothetical protein